MLTIFDGFRDITFANVLIRLFLAVLCGGVIGLERSYKNRPAADINIPKQVNGQVFQLSEASFFKRSAPGSKMRGSIS